MTKTIKELQSLEFAIYQTLTLDDYYEVEFLCKLHGELITCKYMPLLLHIVEHYSLVVLILSLVFTSSNS